MLSTFDYLLDTQDETTSYPVDGNRLVQGRIWYSLNDNSGVYHHGALFDSTTKNLTAVGNDWQAFVSDPVNPLASLPQCKLLVTNLRAIPNPVPVPPRGSRTVTLRVVVENSGNNKATTYWLVRVNEAPRLTICYYDGSPFVHSLAHKGADTVGNSLTQHIAHAWPSASSLWYISPQRGRDRSTGRKG